ncbi:2Fe-2S iron-sulfur cluster-binding protein [Chengkuizengella axinellae]|uniref:2Fe-2S iron-sulfur cluster-binding protein n=1 Tax=Chengkuizengella axinellae TaxID=3064388 RepID=A0ABT9IWP5_9BACL|nr:2Fe-2S iron-sulfur cluster-binding protein [Chengkuizengella sp. 2205SS18-9]MDP5273789.1 2Fe-2S iron-sulfur cluster-binding protein [Chengkuizengella sp. 2205SS18-9]
MSEITFLPHNKKIKVKPGVTLLEASRRARIAISARCGGNAACLLCKVKVDNPSALVPLTENEKTKLSHDQISDNIRLACQTRILNKKVTVSIPESPLSKVVQAHLRNEMDQGI